MTGNVGRCYRAVSEVKKAGTRRAHRSGGRPPTGGTAFRKGEHDMRGRTTARLAVVTIIALSACASDDDGGETDAGSASAPAQATPATSAPVETDPAPSTTVGAQPKRMRAGPMSGGTTYLAAFMDPQVTFTIPEDHGPQSWSAIRLDQEGFVILALQEAPTPGVPPDYEPGLGVSLVSEGVTVDDVVDSVTAHAAANDDFDVTVESGQFGGEDVTVLRGSSSRVGGFVGVPTSGDSGFGFPDRPRRFVAYVVEGPDRLVVVHFDSHELDFDDMVSRATPVLDSIEFV